MLSLPLYMECASVAVLSILGLACWFDFKSSRIPNSLSLASASLGLVLQTLFFGLDGAGNALGGMGVALLVFLTMHLIGGMGAGDVKLMAAVGAWLGPYPTFMACLFSLIAGGVLGVGVLILRKGWRAWWKRYGLMMRCLFTTGSFSYIPAAPDEAAGARFPFALAIAAGTGAALWLTS